MTPRALRVLCALFVAVVPVTSAADGDATYQHNCAMCHQADAAGVTGIYPRLAGHVASIATTRGGGEYLASVVAFGLMGPIQVDGVPIVGVMPGFSSLSSAQIEEVLHYLVARGGVAGDAAHAAIPSAASIDSLRERRLSPSAVHRLRGEVLEGRAAAVGPPSALLDRRASGEREDYARSCQGCHRADGLTDPRVVPPLRDFTGHFTRTPAGRAYLIRVPGVAQAPLDDDRLARLMNWLLRTYSPDQLAPDFVPYTADEVAALRADMLLEVSEARAERIAELQRAGVID
jgi:cytochrome c2